jgi:hypothetical protein
VLAISGKHAQVITFIFKMRKVFGWENVRGGDFVIVECYKLKVLLEHIYDFEENKIKYYVPNRPYLFGSSDDWHVYVLGLRNNRYYVGSCKQLGKALGAHFNGLGISWTQENKVIKLLELITIKPDSGSYLEVKDRLVRDYISRYGWENVRGGQMPPRC